MTTRNLRKPIYLNVGEPSDNPPTVQEALPVPEAETRPKRATRSRRGRRAKGETPGEWLVVGALAEMHKYVNGSIEAPGPFKAADIAKKAEVDKATVGRVLCGLLGVETGGMKAYQQECRKKGNMAGWLAKWQGENPLEDRDLFPEEYGRDRFD